MAAIDKFYTTNREKAKKLCSFIESVGKVSCGIFNGVEYFFNPSDYLYIRSNEIDQDTYDWSIGRPLWNSPTYMDKWLWHNIKDEEVLDDLRWKYGIQEGMSNNEIDKQFVNIDTNFQVGKHYTIIQDCPRYVKRCGKVFWTMYVDVPYDGSSTYSWNYNEETDTFIPRGLPWSSNSKDLYKSVIDNRFLNRFVRKYKLPIGSIIFFQGRYVGQDVKIKIRK